MFYHFPAENPKHFHNMNIIISHSQHQHIMAPDLAQRERVPRCRQTKAEGNEFPHIKSMTQYARELVESHS
jgi:hypothetical protein